MGLFNGYLSAVTGAAIAFAFIGCARVWMNGFESATGLPMLTSLSHLVEIGFLVFVIIWIFAFILAIPFFLLTVRLSKRFRITSFVYFSICGILTAAILIPVFALIDPVNTFLSDEFTSSFLELCVNIAPITLASGLCGGLACWAARLRSGSNSADLA